MARLNGEWDDWMRTPAKWARRRPGRVLSAVGAVVVSAVLLGILGFGYGTIPATCRSERTARIWP